MTKEKERVIARELEALGAYYRNDWSEFDGRTLRDELERLAAFIRDDSASEFTEFTNQLNDQEEVY